MNIRWLVFWSSPTDWFKSRAAQLWCRLFGHKTPYRRTFSAEVCPRCNIVMKHSSPYAAVLTVNRK